MRRSIQALGITPDIIVPAEAPKVEDGDLHATAGPDGRYRIEGRRVLTETGKN